MDRRIGTFKISSEIIKEYPEVARKILDGVIVVRCECLGYEDAFEYVGICDQFKELSIGYITPEYRIVMEQELITDEEGHDTYISIFKGFECSSE